MHRPMCRGLHLCLCEADGFVLQGHYIGQWSADDTFSLLFCNEVVFQDSPKNRIRCQLYLNSLNNVIKELLANGQLLLGA